MLSIFHQERRLFGFGIRICHHVSVVALNNRRKCDHSCASVLLDAVINLLYFVLELRVRWLAFAINVIIRIACCFGSHLPFVDAPDSVVLLIHRGVLRVPSMS